MRDACELLGPWSLERYIVVRGGSGGNRRWGWQIDACREVKEVFTVQEKNMAAALLVQVLGEPSFGLFSNLACRSDEHMVEKVFLVGFGIPYWMGEHHPDLVQHFGDVLPLGLAGGVYFVSLSLDSEIEVVAGGDAEFHPEVSAEFKGFVFVPGD